jgi:hypothetical protein
LGASGCTPADGNMFVSGMSSSSRRHAMMLGQPAEDA